MKQSVWLKWVIGMVLVSIMTLVGCGSTQGSIVETNPSLETKRQATMLKGFTKEMKYDLIDQSKALIDFYPSSGFSAHYWGLLFIRQIDDQAVKYDGYASSTLFGKFDCHFYLMPGEHTISKTQWKNVAEAGPNNQGSRWADNLSITYNFEAGGYYKLWAETFSVDTGRKGLFGLPEMENKVRLVITKLN
jgi:hypothetical protein